MAKPLKCDERHRPSSQGPQYPTLYRRLKGRLGRSLRSKFYKRAVVRAGKKATHKCPRIEGGLPGPSRLQGPVPESNSVSCDGQLNSGSLHQQAGGNSLSRDVRSPVENHDLVPSLTIQQINKWNLSVVLNELTKAPFEPMKDSDLKHLTLKTAFLLALASGKRRSEIHAWVANKVANLGQWEKVALFPSSDFIAKNQLAREGSQSVSPVTIPALTTIVDRQFKEDRTLCPVRALRFYLD